MPSSVLMYNLNSGDSKARNFLLRVQYRTTVPATITVACCGAAIITPLTPMPVNGSGFADFTVSHSADVASDTVTATITPTNGGAAATDTVYRIKFTRRVPDDPFPVIRVEDPTPPLVVQVPTSFFPGFPAKTYICTVSTAAAGVGRHEVTFVVDRAVDRVYVADTVKEALPLDPTDALKFFCPLPAFTPSPTVPDERIVIRAYYTFNSEVIDVFSYNL